MLHEYRMGTNTSSQVRRVQHKVQSTPLSHCHRHPPHQLRAEKEHSDYVEKPQTIRTTNGLYGWAWYIAVTETDYIANGRIYLNELKKQKTQYKTTH